MLVCRGESRPWSGGHVNKQRASSERLREEREGTCEEGGREGRIIVLTAQVNRNTKDNIASPRTSFSCSVYIKLEESYTVILQLHFTL